MENKKKRKLKLKERVINQLIYRKNRNLYTENTLTDKVLDLNHHIILCIKDFKYP